jgi:hypothetical protein
MLGEFSIHSLFILIDFIIMRLVIMVSQVIKINMIVDKIVDIAPRDDIMFHGISISGYVE